MTTSKRRRPWCWQALALGAALAGCGEPPPMVPMTRPGAETDPIKLDLESDRYKAQALGESPAPRPEDEDASEWADSLELCEPTEPGEEVVTDSGLTYSTLEPGDPAGDVAHRGDEISVFYEGKLDSGEVFDGNFGKQPIEFTLDRGLIRGWIEGIAGMRVGERRKLVIPPDLGYGNVGQPGDVPIPPNSTLTFEVVLQGVN